MFFSQVTWLAEAYCNPINITDVGYVMRNLDAATFVAGFLLRGHRENSLYCDFGAGYGMFVRLMRDRGYRFHWHDRYCKNLFASYCEAIPARFAPYRVVTAIEVFEHLADPVEGVREMLQLGPALLFSTELQPDPVPLPGDWWYYGLDHGQHLAFYTPKSLKILAAAFGLQYLCVRPNWHLFAKGDEFEAARQQLVPKRRKWFFQKPEEPAYPPSLTMSDHRAALRLFSREGTFAPSTPESIDWLEGFGKRENSHSD